MYNNNGKTFKRITNITNMIQPTSTRTTVELLDVSNNVYERYTLVNGIEEGIHTKFHCQGQPQNISVKYTVLNGLMDGQYQEWDHLGNKINNKWYSKGIETELIISSQKIHNIISLINKKLFITEIWITTGDEYGKWGHSSFFTFNDRSYCILIYNKRIKLIGIKIMDAKTCEIMTDTVISDNIENNIIEIINKWIPIM